MRLFFLLLFSLSLFAAEFDCILIGTSPFSLFEALYQSHSGKKVLILEGSSQCGGAWKSIAICGIPHADLGCHQIGNDVGLKAFLEEYAGCQIVSMDHPLAPFDPATSPNGYYFSRGCFELIDHLLQLIKATDIVLLTDHQVETLSVDMVQKIAWVQTNRQTFTGEKVILTPMSCVQLHPFPREQNYGKSKYYHLYLLLQDPTPPRFSYQGGSGLMGISRVMNLTHFVGLTDTGRQLIVVQTHGESHLNDPSQFLQGLIQKGLLDPSATLLSAEPYIYETGSFHQGLIAQTGAQDLVQVLQTGHFQTLSQHIAKWKTVLKPYLIALP